MLAHRPLALILVATLSACGADDHPPPLGPDTGGPPTDRLPPTTAAYRAAPCWFVEPAGVAVECGTVIVPEDPTASSGPEITLAVARFFSDAPTVADEPVVYLEGGPGGDASATVSGAFDAFAHFLESRDVVVFDQRGTGHSRPRLDCPEIDSVTVSVGSGTDELTVLDALTACRDRLSRSGVDLNQYTSARNAADVDAVREALGYSRWDLYGISYGTRLGLTVLRDRPEGVRSAVLDGVLPVELEIFGTAATSAQRSFELVFADCAAETACGAAYPDSMTVLSETVARMNATPPEAVLTDGTRLPITGDMVLNLLFLLLYDAESIPYVPALLAQVADGDLSVFELVLSSIGAAPSMALGMYLSVICSEDAPFSSPAAITDAASELLPLFRGFAATTIFDECDRWNVNPAPPIEDQPVVSDIPTLLTSGTYDPVTPPENGDRVASSLLDATHVVLPYESHGASTSACGSALVDRFLAAPDGPASHPCVDALLPRPFEVARGRQEAARARFHVGPIDATTRDALVERLLHHLPTLSDARTR